jgi:hypothetical protein
MCTILQGKELKQNVREGVIMGNHSLGKDDVDWLIDSTPSTLLNNFHTRSQFNVV